MDNDGCCDDRGQTGGDNRSEERTTLTNWAQNGTMVLTGIYKQDQRKGVMETSHPIGAQSLAVDLQLESPEPLYQQLRGILASWIRDSKPRPHGKIPSERQLSERFSVSRMTVRQALGKLKEEGFIYTQPGKGMYVAEPPSGFELAFVLTGYSEETIPMRGVLSSTIIDARLILATAELAEALDLPQAEELVRIERLRSLRGVPVGLKTSHVPHRLCPGYLDHDLSHNAPLEIIRDDYHLPLENITQVVKAGLSGPREMEYLKLSHPVPMLILERKSFLSSGELVQLSEGAYLADCFRLLLTLDLSRWSLRAGGDGQHKSQHQES